MANIRPIETIRVSKRVMDLVIDKLEYIDDDLGKDEITGWEEVFYNCREQGFVLYIDRNTDKGYFTKVWVCQDRRSDQILVATSNKFFEDNGEGNSFGEEPYKNAQYFDYNEEHEAAEYIIKVIKENLHIAD